MNFGDLGDNRVNPLRDNIDHRDPSALIGEEVRRCPTDPAPRPGDDGNPTPDRTVESRKSPVVIHVRTLGHRPVPMDRLRTSLSNRPVASLRGRRL